MKADSKSKIILAILLSISLITTGCTAQWISVALADLPVLTQMALNIGTLVTTLQSGKQLNSTDAAAIQNISSQASKDLNLLQSFYKEYKANPNVGTIQKIQNVIADISQNLPALLQAAHISDPVVSVRVTAGVNLILTTVASFAALMPQNGMPTVQKAVAQKASIPHAADLKKQWNQQVCALSANGSFDSALSACIAK